MSIRSLGFLAREAAMNIGRHGLITMASISTVSISLSILGGFLLVAYQLHTVAEALPRRMEIHAFARTGLPRSESLKVVNRIRAMRGVVEVRLVPREKAWLAFQQRYPQKTDLEGLRENPLPDKYEVRTKKPEQIFWVAKAIGALPQVAHVSESTKVLENLLRIARLVRLVGITCAALLLLATVAVISNAIRITLFSRRREIRIMQLVGATNGFIRLPFMFEGIFDGAAGAALACGVVAGGYHYLSQAALTSVPLLSELQIAVPFLHLLTVLTSLGILIGALGSMISIRRFLRVS
jgi:cell division transport system permease protein